MDRVVFRSPEFAMIEPIGDHVYLIIFCGRELKDVSPLRSAGAFHISDACREAVEDTWTRIANVLMLTSHGRAAELRQLQHGIKGGTVEFLQELDLLVGQDPPIAQSDSLARLYLRAITITGPHDAIQAVWTDRAAHESLSLHDAYKDHIRLREPYYETCANLWKKHYLSSIPGRFTDHGLANTRIKGGGSLLRGVMDILVCNAIRHGGSHIQVDVRDCGQEVAFMVSDDGKGMSEGGMVAIKRGASIKPSGGAFGLEAASRASRLFGWRLVVTSERNPTEVALLCKKQGK